MAGRLITSLHLHMLSQVPTGQTGKAPLHPVGGHAVEGKKKIGAPKEAFM